MKDTRTKLLKTAARLFARKGYNGVSVRQIIQAAGTNISAINYHFGDKQGLYLHTIQYLLDQNRVELLKNVSLPTPEQIQTMSNAQLLQAVHNFCDYLLDMKFDHKHLLLDRITSYAELESSDKMMTILLSYATPLSDMLGKIFSKLTGLKEKTPQIILLIHTIFWQLNISECDQFVVMHILGRKELDTKLRNKIKDFVWNNILNTIKLYERGIQKA